MKITIGTRGSDLSLKQTTIIKEKLNCVFSELQTETITITTKGDKNMKPIPLDSIGKGWFTKEIDAKLLSGEIDLAVHSLKDLPETLPDGLLLAAIPTREDAREVLVSKNGQTLETLKPQAIIGTDSTRRKSQLLFRRPDIQVMSVRGNVNTRLKKLEEEDYDALILAAAGLIRLGFQKTITQYFSPGDFVPSPGQGALAVVVHKKNSSLIKLVEKINDRGTIQAVTAEREFSSALGGGCKTPVGAYAKVQNNTLEIHGFIGSIDGKYNEHDVLSGNSSKSKELGRKLAKKLLDTCRSWYQV